MEWAIGALGLLPNVAVTLAGREVIFKEVNNILLAIALMVLSTPVLYLGLVSFNSKWRTHVRMISLSVVFLTLVNIVPNVIRLFSNHDKLDEEKTYNTSLDVLYYAIYVVILPIIILVVDPEENLHDQELTLPEYDQIQDCNSILQEPGKKEELARILEIDIEGKMDHEICEELIRSLRSIGSITPEQKGMFAEFKDRLLNSPFLNFIKAKPVVKGTSKGTSKGRGSNSSKGTSSNNSTSLGTGTLSSPENSLSPPPRDLTGASAATVGPRRAGMGVGRQGRPGRRAPAGGVRLPMANF